MIPIREDLLISTKRTVQPQYLGHGDPALKDCYPAWVNNIADDATVEGSMLNGALLGADAVRSVVLTIRSLIAQRALWRPSPRKTNRDARLGP